MAGLEPTSPGTESGALPIYPHGLSYLNYLNACHIMQRLQYIAIIVTIRARKSDTIKSWNMKTT